MDSSDIPTLISVPGSLHWRTPISSILRVRLTISVCARRMSVRYSRFVAHSEYHHGGASTWSVWDGWTVTITGAVPQAQVVVAVGSWSGALGYADAFGNFTISGYAYPGNVGTTNELWTVGGALVNPSPLVITVVP
jgi:hypothetical protein